LTQTSWHLVVRLSGRADDGTVAVIGSLVGEVPPVPFAATVFVGDRSLEVEVVAFEPAPSPLPDGSVAAQVRGMEPDDAPSGSVLTARGVDRPALPQPPGWEFGRRVAAPTARRTVGFHPDHGGVLFRIGGGMAPVDTFASQIKPELQRDLDAWYREWDESTSTDRWSNEELRREGERLVEALQAELGPDSDVYFDL